MGGIEPERGAITARSRPQSFRAGGEPEADAEGGPDSERFRALDDGIQLAGHFDDENDPDSHPGGLKREVDEGVVLVAVADEEGLGIFQVGEGGEELGTGSGFEAVVVAAPEFHDFLNDLLLLVDLDGIDAAVLATVAALFNGMSKGAVEFLDAPI